MNTINEQENIEHEEDEHRSDEHEMTFLDHLEELRWRIVKVLMGLLVCVGITGYFSDWIVNVVILRPGKLTNPPIEIINTIPYGQITFYMVVVVVTALIMVMPWFLYQVWKFIQPGLRQKEQKYISGIVFFTSFCFLSGVAFAYFALLPFMLQFFATFGTTDIKNMISISEYISFVLQLVVISGIIFELPMIAYILARFGILTPAFMRHYRRHSFLAIFIFAAFITPTTDPITMLFFSLPILGLYEISIWIAGVAKRKRDSEDTILN